MIVVAFAINKYLYSTKKKEQRRSRQITSYEEAGC